jgi:formylglycine-generating enzyme required for sulfatase activity
MEERVMTTKIIGNVTAKHLLGGIYRAGRPGVKAFVNYLSESPIRCKAWEKTSNLQPSVMLARASLNSNWQERAAMVIEKIVDAECRKQVLMEIINSNKIAFRDWFAGTQVKISEIECFIRPRLPEIQKEMIRVKKDESTRPGADYEETLLDKIKGVKIPTFLIDKIPVTNAMYSVFMKYTGHEPPEFWADYETGIANIPVVGVSFFDAWKFAEWLGERLPTEEEWAKAAIGGFCLAGHESEWVGHHEGSWCRISFNLQKGSSPPAFKDDCITFRTARDPGK